MPVSYIGGKSRIGKWIKNYIPYDIEIYVECFGGMYWTFFCLDIDKYRNLKTVVYNDFNPLNVNVFNCLKNYKEFYNVIRNYESQDKDKFNQYQKELFGGDFVVDLTKPDYHTACKYLYLLTQVWSGTNPEKGKFIDLKGKYNSKFDSFKKKLQSPKWQKFFDKINVTENLDFEDLIVKYDSPNTYFYCDPPYFKTETYYANHEFGLHSHQRLADCLKSIKGKFSLSYYYFDKLTEWFPSQSYAWANRQFSKAAMAKSGKQQTKATELLIMNY